MIVGAGHVKWWLSRWTPEMEVDRFQCKTNKPLRSSTGPLFSWYLWWVCLKHWKLFSWIAGGGREDWKRCKRIKICNWAGRVALWFWGWQLSGLLCDLHGSGIISNSFSPPFCPELPKCYTLVKDGLRVYTKFKHPPNSERLDPELEYFSVFWRLPYKWGQKLKKTVVSSLLTSGLEAQQHNAQPHQNLWQEQRSLFSWCQTAP